MHHMKILRKRRCPAGKDRFQPLNHDLEGNRNQDHAEYARNQILDFRILEIQLRSSNPTSSLSQGTDITVP